MNSPRFWRREFAAISRWQHPATHSTFSWQNSGNSVQKQRSSHSIFTKPKRRLLFLLQYATIVFFIFRAIYCCVCRYHAWAQNQLWLKWKTIYSKSRNCFYFTLHSFAWENSFIHRKTAWESNIYIQQFNTLFHHWCSPLILWASCMSLGIIVTLLACIAHKFVSLKRLTKYASDASCRHTTASMVNLMPKLISLAISCTKL